VSTRLTKRGFTLIEVLVSVFIFSIVAVLAYGGYSQAAKSSLIADEKMQRIEQLQTTIRLFTQDFEQLAPRGIRDVLGQSVLPSLSADARAQYVVALTRAGWSNPAGLQRSTLQRVQYIVEENKLRREHWTVLDATLADEPVKRELIDKVKSVKLRYMDSSKVWQEQWPPLGQAAAAGSAAAARLIRPLAVEVKLDLEDFGEITRIIEVGG